MPTRTTPWPQGTPSWVELGVDDPERMTAFYSALFGWEFAPGEEETGFYQMAFSDGKPAAAISPKMDGHTDMPTYWSTYFATDDVDGSAKKVVELGGQIVAGPMKVMDFGYMAYGIDPSGAAFGLWQAGDHTGYHIYNEPNSVVWNELHTRDLNKALEFNVGLFGYQYEDLDIDNYPMPAKTLMLSEPENQIGSIAEDADIPEGAPPYWLVWFGTDDTDALVGKATSLGGNALVAPMDTNIGRMALIQGPEGEVFGVISMNADSSE